MPLLSDAARRKRNLLVISGVLLLLGIGSAVNFGIPASNVPVASNLVVFALFNLNLIVFLLLLVLLFRNLVKLGFERRHKVVGAKFKTKLVLAFLSLALTPALLIFLVASNFIARSIEGWFKPQVERPLDQALVVAQTYYHNLEVSALRHAHRIGRVIGRDELLTEDRREALAAYLVDQQEQLGVTTITVIGAQGQELAHVKDPALGTLPTRDVAETHVRRALTGQDVTTVREMEAGDLIEGVAPIRVRRGSDTTVVGAVVVGIRVAERLESKIRGISQAFKEYKQARLLRAPIKGIYTLLFLLATLIIVFSFTWFGLYLARGITDPIQQLAEGTREVAAGNLSYKVQARGDDEIATLVESFNRMTDDLSESKRRLEEAYLDLQDKHTELEDRRRYIETLVQAVGTGVVSLDPEGRVTTVNRAAARILDIGEAGSVGRRVEEVFGSADLSSVVTLVQRACRAKEGSAALEMHLRRRDRATVSLLASATALRGLEGEYAGAVVVFDDLTDLLKAQRLAAWREVAQRIAHEIKNPLTPIQLSAQRLRRRLARDDDEHRLVTECTETIIQEVEGLRRLVDEFSRFARMPALVPRPTDVRPLVESVATLYRESHPALHLVTRYSDDMPLVEVDPDHLKRAILNLVDNAVEAVSGAGDVVVEVASLPGAGRIRVVVSDTGPGVAPEDKEKLFQPYFSTKVTGMGLGLPIVHEIVAEHGGSVRVEDNDPRGSRFIIEVPVSRAVDPVETAHGG